MGSLTPTSAGGRISSSANAVSRSANPMIPIKPATSTKLTPDTTRRAQLRVSLAFEPFEVDLRTGELRKAGVHLKLAGQPFQVLAILLEQPGEVVTREELQKRLWPDTFVDFDHNLNTAINKIREALGDSAERPRFVETLPRRGYRFVAQVEGTRTTEPPGASGVRQQPRVRW